jgi:hypothetical protein
VKFGLVNLGWFDLQGSFIKASLVDSERTMDHFAKIGGKKDRPESFAGIFRQLSLPNWHNKATFVK